MNDNNYSMDELRDALSYISSDTDRAPWVEIGMAMKNSGFDESDFLQWSANARSYKESDARSAWRSFKYDPSHGVTAGTIVMRAKAEGWTPPQHEKPKKEHAAAPKQQNQQPHELPEPPKEYTFTAEDFTTDKPYKTVLQYYSNDILYYQEREKLAQNAKAVKVKSFSKLMAAYEKQHAGEMAAQGNTLAFDGLDLALSSKFWYCNTDGIFRADNNSLACIHPIVPVETIIDADTNLHHVKIAFTKPGMGGRWEQFVTPMDKISATSTIVPFLANKGVSITSLNASAMVQYLRNIIDENQHIPVKHGIARMGYVQGFGFVPYIDNLTYDGEANYASLFSSIGTSGNESRWCNAMREAARKSKYLKFMIAGSFASPLVAALNGLPFFVHVWSTRSGNGKSVALHCAASVWANPSVYVQTFNGTQVGHERTAAFLNQLPLCLDESQLARNKKGEMTFDAYRLAEGIGRTRGTASGGVDITPRWKNCFLTTGETDIVSKRDGAGAKNRIISIQIPESDVVLDTADCIEIMDTIAHNYGHAGKWLSDAIYSENGQRLYELGQQCKEINTDLCKRGVTGKQAVSAAVLIVGSRLMAEYLGDNCAQIDIAEILPYLQTEENLSKGNQAYTYLCEWVVQNTIHFIRKDNYNVDIPVTNTECYGKIIDGVAMILPSVFDKALAASGYSEDGTIDYLLRNGHLLKDKAGKTKQQTRINGNLTRCYWLQIQRPVLADKQQPEDTENFDIMNNEDTKNPWDE